MSGPDPEDSTIEVGDFFECADAAGEIVTIFCPNGEMHQDLPADLVRAVVIKIDQGKFMSVGLPEGLRLRPVH